MSRSLAAALASALILASTPLAAQVAGAGSKQITFGGGGLVGEDYQSLNATVGLTQYLSDRLEAGAFLSATFSKSEGTDGTVSGYLFGNWTWNFVSESLTVPFLFFGAGTPLDDERVGDLAIQGGAGFKRFVNENFSFNGQASMIGQKVNGQMEFGDFMLLNFGFSYYIR